MVLEELKVENDGPIKLYCDNKSAISISRYPARHDRTKHVEVNRHFIKEKIEKGDICMSYVSTTKQVVDMFTKSLGKFVFEKLIGKLRM